MHEQPKHITDEQVKHLMPTNIRFTPVNITMPKVAPMRDDKVSLK